MPDLTGQSISRYQILEQLGEGGMATVYKAYDTRLERNVAVKVLRTDQFIPAQLHMVLQRFEREAKSLAKISHPSIVNVLDFGEHEDKPFLVMEYLPGGTLKNRLGHAIPWQETFHTLLPVARGLAYAHQHNIIHRDVKPGNILIDENEEPILTDFGIAKLLESAEGHTLTGSGVGIGTPEYMAPEQGIGASSIDARADIYSLGIVLYEMITGRKPYIADTPMAVVLKQMNDPLPHPTDFVSDLPEGVEHILFKALAKQPDDRYADMKTLIAAMESLLAQAIESRRSRRPAVSTGLFSTILKGLFISILVIGLGIGGYYAWQQWGENIPNPFVAETPNIPDPSVTETPVEKVCFIMTDEDTYSYRNSTIWHGILDTADTLGIQKQSYLTRSSPEEVQSTLGTMYAEDCNAIIGSGEWLKEQFLESARKNPNIYFLLVDISYSGAAESLPDNLIVQTYKVHDGAYLAGYLAAGTTMTGKLGMFGSSQINDYREYMEGFIEGVARFNQDHSAQIPVIVWNADGQSVIGWPGNWTGWSVENIEKPMPYESMADELIREGADTIFIVGAPSASRGAVALSESKQVLFIGVDVDWKLQYGGHDYPDAILASIVKNYDVMISKLIRQLVSGTYEIGAIEGTLENYGIELSHDNAIDDQFLSELYQIWDELAEISNQTTIGPAVLTLMPTTTPTPTRTPRLTPTPTSQPIWVTDFAEPILSEISNHPPTLHDNLDDNSGGWYTASHNKSSQLQFVDGELILDGCRAYRSKMAYTDFVLEIDTHFLEGTADNSQFVIYYRDYYSFAVHLDGRLTISTMYSDEVQIEIPGKAYTNQRTNHILIIAQGNRYAFYVNDKPIHYLEDNHFFTREAIFFVAHPGPLAQATYAKVALDNLKIWDLEKIPSLP